MQLCGMALLFAIRLNPSRHDPDPIQLITIVVETELGNDSIQS